MGLELFRESDGAPFFRVGARCFKKLGLASIGWNYTGNARSGNFADTRFADYPNNYPMIIVTDGSVDVLGNTANISITGNTVYWMFNDVNGGSIATRPNCTFLYGLF